LIPALAPAASADDFVSHTKSFSDSFLVSPPRPVRDFEGIEAILPVPAVFDPVGQSFLQIGCRVSVEKNFKATKSAKGIGWGSAARRTTPVGSAVFAIPIVILLHLDKGTPGKTQGRKATGP